MQGNKLNNQTDKSPDVTILGAGIIGVTCALELLEQGLSVTVVDRLSPGEATSYGNAGSISPWSVVPLATPGVWKSVPRWLLDPQGPVKVRWRDLPEILPWVAGFLRNSTMDRVTRISDGLSLMMRDNVSLYRRHLHGTGAEDLITDAMLVTAYRGAAKPSLDDLGYRLRIERGAKVEIIGAHDLRDLEPAISHEYHSAGLVKEQGRTRDPGRLCKVLGAKAEQMGAVFVSAEVRRLQPQDDGSTIMETTTDPIYAQKLVLAAGVWSADLLRPLGFKLPLIAERGYHLEFMEPGITLNNSVQDVDAKVILSTMDNGLRVAGTAEFAHIDAPPNYRRAERLAPLSRRLLPDLQTEPKRRWMGIRPSFPDNLPAIGAFRSAPGIIAAFGHNHHGLGMAPVTARMVAAEVAGTPGNEDVSALSPDRF
jgi:D-amino-acid dehydrogenase